MTTTATVRIALVGDYDPAVRAHAAIPMALCLAMDELGCAVQPAWLATGALARDAASKLAPFQAIWCAPGSPYHNMKGALNAIRFARESGRPFLGTCGGFQHAIIESVRHV